MSADSLSPSSSTPSESQASDEDIVNAAANGGQPPESSHDLSKSRDSAAAVANVVDSLALLELGQIWVQIPALLLTRQWY